MCTTGVYGVKPTPCDENTGLCKTVIGSDFLEWFQKRQGPPFGQLTAPSNSALPPSDRPGVVAAFKS